MKPITLLTIITFLFAACKQKPAALSALNTITSKSTGKIQKLHPFTADNRKNYIVSIDQKLISSVKENVDYGSFITVPVKLTNWSDDTLKYINMSCDNRGIFRVNNIRLSVVQIAACQHNIPEFYLIAPGHSERFDLPVSISKKKGGTQTFKVGINLQIYVALDDLDEYTHDRLVDANSANIIWSNEVRIP